MVMTECNGVKSKSQMGVSFRVGESERLLNFVELNNIKPKYLNTLLLNTYILLLLVICHEEKHIKYKISFIYLKQVIKYINRCKCF
jgi:hypothetical protein